MDKESSVLRREALLGLPVFDQASGRQLGTVTDVAIGGSPPRMQTLLVGGRLLPYDRIQSISSNGIAIASDALLPGRKLADSGPEWMGKEVMKRNGESLGTISDVIIDPPSGRIAGLELSQSFVDDLMDGRRYLPLLPTYRVQGDALFITDEEEKYIVPGGGGIKNLFGSKLS